MSILTADTIEANSTATGGDNRNFSTHLLQYWDKTGSPFINGGVTFPVVFEPGDAGFSISFGQANQNAPVWTLRWVVRDGSQWYISDASMVTNTNDLLNPNNSVEANDTYILSPGSITATSDGLWALYDPNDTSRLSSAAGAGLDFDFESGIFADRNFTNITALGIYVENDTHDNSNKFLDIFQFSVDASVIPEPSTWAMSGFGLFGLAWLMRRKMRKQRLKQKAA